VWGETGVGYLVEEFKEVDVVGFMAEMLFQKKVDGSF
jgi:hypothetical protein